MLCIFPAVSEANEIITFFGCVRKMVGGCAVVLSWLRIGGLLGTMARLSWQSIGPFVKTLLCARSLLFFFLLRFLVPSPSRSDRLARRAAMQMLRLYGLWTP